MPDDTEGAQGKGSGHAAPRYPANQRPGMTYPSGLNRCELGTPSEPEPFRTPAYSGLDSDPRRYYHFGYYHFGNI